MITGAGENLDDHSTWVADLMVGPFGVAESASLYSSAYETEGIDPGYFHAIQSLQRIATRPNSAGTRAINNSWFKPGSPNGDSSLTRGVDWLASQHEVLLAFAGNEVGGLPVPQDNFNGITVAASARAEDGVFREVWGSNIFDPSFDNDRTFIDLIAPGENIEVSGLGDDQDTRSGTSYAVPYVTGTAALLQQYGDYQITNVGGARWGAQNSRRHEVMKAVLLNSADQLAGVHGSKRTVVSNDAEGNYDWEDTAAFDLASVSLDLQLGAGHLNAKRALTQFSSGEWGVGSDVPAIGWDYHETGGTGTILRYTLPENIGGYFAVTLAWDRQVEKVGGSDDFYDPTNFFITAFNDLDLYLVPVGWDELAVDAVALSVTDDDNVEHIFADVPAGNYEIVVRHFGGAGTDQDYGLAWWHGNPYPTGDFDQDTDVDEDDLSQWESDYGTNSFSDADGDGDSDGEDFLAWQRNYGVGTLAEATAVPEPNAGALALAAVLLVMRRRPLEA